MRLPVLHTPSAWLLLLALAPACHRAIDFGDRGQVTEPRELLSLIDLSDATLQRLEGEARLRMESPSAKGVVTLFLAVSAPAAMHLEALNFFGRPSAVLVSDGTSFGFHDAEEGRYSFGPATEDTVSRFLPLKLGPEQWVSVFLGRAPRMEAHDVQLFFDGEKRAYVLTLVQGSSRQRLWVHPRNHRVLRSEWEGRVSYTLDFEAMAHEKAVTYPTRIRMEVPSLESVAELRWVDVQLNPTLDPALFDLSPPPHVPVRELDGEGNPVAPLP